MESCSTGTFIPIKNPLRACSVPLKSAPSFRISFLLTVLLRLREQAFLEEGDEREEFANNRGVVGVECVPQLFGFGATAVSATSQLTSWCDFSLEDDPPDSVLLSE